MDVPLATVRTCVKGAPFVKAMGEALLPNPSNALSSDMTDPSTKARFDANYSKFLKEAEFDDYTQLTERVMVGKLAFDKAQIEVPDRLSYLLKSADGDGLSIRGLLENCAQNVLAAKWHVVLCDYQGLAGLDITSASIADVEAANPRAMFKEYPRESVYHASYTVVNGVKQLSLLVLREVGMDIDPLTLAETEVESFLILSLIDGAYNQRKTTNISKSETKDSGNIPVLINGSPVPFIPAYIVADEELTAGNLPEQLGFLAPIADICLARYGVSAKFKAALSKFVPTIFISGMTQETFEATKAINGSKVLDMNSVNVLAGNDEGVAPTVEMVSASGKLEDFHQYNQESLDKLRSLGAAVPNDESASTATKAKIDAAQQNAVLSPIADNLEQMLIQLLGYAAMFKGLVAPDAIDTFSEQLTVSLTRDFAAVKGTPEEMAMLVNMFVTGLRTKEQVIKMTHALGWDIESVDDVLAQIDLNAESVM